MKKIIKFTFTSIAALASLVCCGKLMAVPIEKPTVVFEKADIKLPQEFPDVPFPKEEGAIEIAAVPSFSAGEVNGNQDIVRFKYNKDNGGGFYYNAELGGLVFYMLDKDSNLRGQNKEYPVFVPTGKLSFKKDVPIHLVATWQNGVQRIYINGKSIRHVWDCSPLEISKSTNATVELFGGNSQFSITKIKIWDKAKGPEESNFDASKVLVEEAKVDHQVTQLNAPNLKASIDETGNLAKLTILNQTENLLSRKTVAKMWASADSEIRGITWNTAWSQEGSGLICTFVAKNAGESDLKVNVSLTLPILQDGMTAFLAADDCPFPVGVGRKRYDRSRRLIYGNQVSLPLVSVLDSTQNVGLTVSCSDQTNENIVYDVGSEDEPGNLKITHRDILLKKGGEVLIKWYLSGHVADWRASLGAYAELFPAILSPPVAQLDRTGGGMIIGGPSDSDFLELMRSLGVDWRQISLHLGEGAGFGNYIPDDLAPYRKVIDDFRKGTGAAAKAGIKDLYYIQARECKDLEQAKGLFSDSMVKNQNGEYVVDEFGNFGASMTCRPGSPWFEHLENQAERILETFPDAGGLFFDNAATLEYAEIVTAVGKIAHGRGRAIATNGANAKIVGVSDAIMAESHLTVLGSLKYLGLARPVEYVPIYSAGVVGGREKEMVAPGLPENLRSDLRQCLLDGANYSFNYRGVKLWPESSVEILRKYLPLQQKLVGRKWVLSPNALRVPENVRGNVFEAKNGNWLIALVADEKSSLKTAYIQVQNPVANVVPESIKMYCPGKDEQVLSFSRNEGEIRFSIPSDEEICLVEISWKKAEKLTEKERGLTEGNL